MDALQLKQLIAELLAEIDNQCAAAELNPNLTRVSSMYAAKMTSPDAATHIYGFILHYIEATPVLMEVLNKLGRQYRMDALIEPYIQLASNYLNSTCQELSQSDEADSLKHLLTLLQGSYIFHRMIEELDDRIQHFIGIPLTHIDMMNANVIIHDIIGDQFANKLDQLIESMFQQSKVTKTIIEAQLDRQQIDLFRSAGKALSGESIYCFAKQKDLSLF